MIPDENKLAKQEAPARIDPAKTKQVQELKQSSPLFSCRFDPSGRFVFAGAQGNKVLRWELATGKNTDLVGHNSWVRGLAFLPGEKLLFTAGYEGKVIAWQVDAETPTPVRTIDAHQGWVRAVAVSPDGKYLASCGNDNLVKLWSTVDGLFIREMTGHTCHVYNLAFHPREPFLVSGDLKGVVKHWDYLKGALVRELDAKALYKYDETFRADIGGIRGIAFNNDGSLLACSGITDVTNAFANIGKPAIVLFDWQTGQRKHLLRPKEDFTGVGWGVAFHPDGFLAGVGGGTGGALWYWKPDQPQSFFTLKLTTNARDVALHPDGHRLAVACFDGVLRIYDMAEPTPA